MRSANIHILFFLVVNLAVIICHFAGCLYVFTGILDKMYCFMGIFPFADKQLPGI